MQTPTQDTMAGQYADDTVAAHRAALVLRLTHTNNGRPPNPKAMGFPDLTPFTIAYLSAIRPQITHEEVTT